VKECNVEESWPDDTTTTTTTTTTTITTSSSSTTNPGPYWAECDLFYMEDFEVDDEGNPDYTEIFYANGIKNGFCRNSRCVNMSLDESGEFIEPWQPRILAMDCFNDASSSSNKAGLPTDIDINPETDQGFFPEYDESDPKTLIYGCMNSCIKTPECISFTVKPDTDQIHGFTKCILHTDCRVSHMNHEYPYDYHHCGVQTGGKNFVDWYGEDGGRSTDCWLLPGTSYRSIVHVHSEMNNDHSVNPEWLPSDKSIRVEDQDICDVFVQFDCYKKNSKRWGNDTFKEDTHKNPSKDDYLPQHCEEQMSSEYKHLSVNYETDACQYRKDITTINDELGNCSIFGQVRSCTGGETNTVVHNKLKGIEECYDLDNCFLEKKCNLTGPNRSWDWMKTP